MNRRRLVGRLALGGVVVLAAFVALDLLASYLYLPVIGDLGSRAITDAATLPGMIQVCGRSWHEDQLVRIQTVSDIENKSGLAPVVVVPLPFAPCPARACNTSPYGSCTTVIYARVGEDAYVDYSLAGGP